MSAYYFDTLPVHPQPERLESFTSYLIRLAEANGIRSVPELFKLCFPEGRRGFSLNTGDYPPRSFGLLPTIAACPEPRLLATTFYYLAQKFGRKPEPQPLSLSMSGALSPGLRYCPDCLAQPGYASLAWRFVALRGCPEHGHRLLDHCGHCDQKIPLLTQPLTMSLCPLCQGDLRTCQAEPLTESARQTAQLWFQDLAFLLSPLTREPPEIRMVEFMGEQFTRWRHLRRLKVADAADYIEQSAAAIYFIEKGATHRTAKLQWYFGYADFLKIRFQTLFEAPLPPQPTRTFEDRLVEKVQQALVSLEPNGERVTQQAMGQLLGVCASTISNYPQARALCRASQSQWDQQRVTELVGQVQQTAVEMFEETGQPITQKALCHQLGWSMSGLSDYPQVKAALQQAVATSHSRYEQRVLQAVQTALAQLETTGTNMTQQAISHLTGISLKTMNRLPTVRSFLKEQLFARKQEYQIRAFQQREQKLLLEVQQAIGTLRAAGRPVTRRAICQLINRGQSTLQRYPRIQLLLKEMTLAKSQPQTG